MVFSVTFYIFRMYYGENIVMHNEKDIKRFKKREKFSPLKWPFKILKMLPPVPGSILSPRIEWHNVNRMPCKVLIIGLK